MTETLRKGFLLRSLCGIFLFTAAAMLSGALYVEDYMSMGYLMGLYTVCLLNATLLFSLASLRPGAIPTLQLSQPKARRDPYSSA